MQLKQELNTYNCYVYFIVCTYIAIKSFSNIEPHFSLTNLRNVHIVTGLIAK